MKDQQRYPVRMGFPGEENTPPPDPRTPGHNGSFEHSEDDKKEPFDESAGANPPAGEDETDEYEKKFRYYIAMLENEDSGRRWKAAESLARMGDARAVGPLIEALSDEDWRVRQKTAWALGYLGDPAAIPALRKAYRNDLDGVREMITEAITVITMGVPD
ncbi:MAG: HEAT repeat domain-containing protein [Methanomicrobiales archaeon]